MPGNDPTEKTRESRETISSLGEQKDLGEHGTRFIDTLGNVAEKVADSTGPPAKFEQYHVPAGAPA